MADPSVAQEGSAHSAHIASTVVLLRATELSNEVIAFAKSVAAFSGCPVAFVIDERSAPPEQDGRTIIRVSKAGCEKIGLHCPAQFAWSCGDYGYYLARQALPQCRLFWLIEHDVRFAPHKAAEFFAFFAIRPDVDLIAPYLSDAASDWYWTHTATGRQLVAKRCFFPVTRLSARAIDILRSKRIAHGRNPLRRVVWPNDEAMVATTLADAGLTCRDINGFGQTFYATDTFSYRNVLDGDEIDWSGSATTLYHPVLFGDQVVVKRRQFSAEAPAGDRPARRRQVLPRLATRLNRLSTW